MAVTKSPLAIVLQSGDAAVGIQRSGGKTAQYIVEREFVQVQESLCLKGAVGEHIAAGERGFPFCQEGLNACEGGQTLHAVRGHALGIEL